jgi:hypothetical protein
MTMTPPQFALELLVGLASELVYRYWNPAGNSRGVREELEAGGERAEAT